MTTSIVSETDLEVQIQSRNIEISGRLFQIAKITEYCWVLTDLASGDAKQFAEASAMWRYIGAIKQFVPDLSIPQLPAYAESWYKGNARRINKEARRFHLSFLSRHGKRYPTRGVIALPASMTPEQPKSVPKAPQLTKAQAKAREDFLDQAERYFRLVTEVTHARISNYTRNNYDWQISNARLAAGQAASRFVQFVSQGI